MMKIIFATGNKDKMAEIREIMEDLGYECSSMKEEGIESDPEENGTSFEENAVIKAQAVYDIAKARGIEAIVMADDSGLEIDCLNGEPGIYSARYLGRDVPYSVKNADLIKRTDESGDSDRTARFVCAVAAFFSDGTHEVVRGTVEGVVANTPSGNSGFGYDPIFFLPDRGCTTADLTNEEKNAISHRGNALRMMKEILVKKYHS
ncbi:MAG: RdgB/HAM1 family non-canonical purine NTP pyrophosphatase [Lachnospiraceae bacterium]|nr:RdgB/HAM1 family non-canonical purine NTP pyrophosphatase [Lachnospiraceae bacterium]